MQMVTNYDEIFKCLTKGLNSFTPRDNRINPQTYGDHFSFLVKRGWKTASMKPTESRIRHVLELYPFPVREYRKDLDTVGLFRRWFKAAYMVGMRLGERKSWHIY